MTGSLQRVVLDLNNPSFQRDLFSLEKDEVWKVIASLRKLSQLTWTEVYRDTGLRWELIESRRGPNGERLYSLRLSQKARGVALREGQFLRLLTLHPDHDSAYKR